MAKRDIITIGASAGGVEALSRFVRGLPAGLPAAIFVVLHIPAAHISWLPQILSRAGPLPAIHPVDGERIEAGRIYVAPPDQHLLVQRGFVNVTRGPLEHGHRPAVDATFRSAAMAYGPRVIGIVLSGNLDDGTAGLASVQQHGGTAIVQDPHDASSPGMPTSVLEQLHVEHVLLLDQIPSFVLQLIQQEIDDAPAKPSKAETI